MANLQSDRPLIAGNSIGGALADNDSEEFNFLGQTGQPTKVRMCLVSNSLAAVTLLVRVYEGTTGTPEASASAYTHVVPAGSTVDVCMDGDLVIGSVSIFVNGTWAAGDANVYGLAT